MKKIVLLLFLMIPLISFAQKGNDLSKYLVGAVKLTNGQVSFDQTYSVPGKNKFEIYDLLKAYTKKEILQGENHLEQCGFTENDSINGLLAASVEEYLYFKRAAFVTHRVRFSYQLIYRIADERPGSSWLSGGKNVCRRLSANTRKTISVLIFCRY